VLSGGDITGSAKFATGFAGDVITLGVTTAVVAVFYTLAVLYPTTRARDSEARTRSTDG
jgi:hypothetical protein